MRKPLLILFFPLIFQAMLFAQPVVKSSVDKREIRIGEPVALQLEVNYPAGIPVQWFSVPDTFNTLEVSKREKPDTIYSGGGTLIKQKLLITGFDSGRFVIPSFSIVLSGQQISSDSFSITVNPVKLEGADYKDIRDIEEAGEEVSNEYLWWIAGIASALLLLVLIYLMLRNRKKAAVNTLLRKEAYEEAMDQLKQLRSEKLTERGEDLQFYTRLADIFRTFLQGEKGIRSMEKTSVGILSELQRMNLHREALTSVGIALRRCDFVKFAKYIPTAKENEETFGSIENTITIIHRPS